MNILSIVITILFLLICIYAISEDIKMAKRIMKNEKTDKTLKEDLEELINKKTRLYFTEKELSSTNINPFSLKTERIKI